MTVKQIMSCPRYTNSTFQPHIYMTQNLLYTIGTSSLSTSCQYTTRQRSSAQHTFIQVREISLIGHGKLSSNGNLFRYTTSDQQHNQHTFRKFVILDAVQAKVNVLVCYLVCSKYNHPVCWKYSNHLHQIYCENRIF